MSTYCASNLSFNVGSGCGSVGRAVASNTTDQGNWIQSLQNFNWILILNELKDENKETKFI